MIIVDKGGWIVVVGILGVIVVGLGVFGVYGLEGMISECYLVVFNIGVDY